MPIDLIAAAFELIVGQGLELAKDKAKRSERILKILNAIGLKQDAPPANDFNGVYAYTLVVYGIDKPKPILEFFRHQIIKDAFRKSFEQRDSSILEEETENFLDWNVIGRDILAIDYDPKREFAEFRELFITSAKLTRTVQEVLVDHKLEDISGKMQELPTREDFESLAEIIQQPVSSITIHIEGDNQGNIIIGDENILNQQLFPIADAIEDVSVTLEELPTREDLTTQLSTFKDEIIGAIGAISKREKVIPFILPQLDISNFTGREDELTQLEKQIFQEGGSRIAGIVGVTGTGGMGKSALAFHFAHKYKDRFPDGVIGLRIDSGTVNAVAERFASHVGIKPETLKNYSAAEIMQSVFRERQALLIFDNAEEASVSELRPGGNRCAVIVTTRNQGLLKTLDIPMSGHVDLQRFDFEETKQLLSSLIGSDRVVKEEAAVKEIHRLVGGFPLAVRIVGGLLVDQEFITLSEFSKSLEDERLRLSKLRDPDDALLDVRASLTLSLKHLTTTQNELFALLGICAKEGFALATVYAITSQEKGDIDAGLARLIRLSLLNKGNEIDRFIFHPLLHALASEIATEKNLYQSAEEKHTSYFVDFANKHRKPSMENLDAIENELDGLLLSAHRLLGHEIVNYGYYLALEPFFQTRGYWSQALEIIDSYLELAKKIDDWHSVVQLLIQRGQFLQIIGKLDDAEKAFDESDRELDKVEDVREQNRLRAMVLNSLGVVLQRQGKFDKAVEIFSRSAEIEEAAGNKRGQAIVLNSLGSVLQRQGKFEEAAHAFELSAVIEDKSGNKRGQAIVLNSLGGVKQRQGNFDEAVTAIKKSYELLLDIGDERGQAMVLNSLGGVYQRQGKFDEAVTAFQKSAIIEEKLKNDRGQAMVLNSLGGVLQRQGKYEEAVTAFQKSYELLVKLEDDRGQAMVLNSLGGVLQRQGKFEEAVTAFQKSAAIGEKLEDYRHLAMVLNSLGGVLQRQGKFEEAVTAFQKSAAIGEKLEDYRHLAMVLNSLGGVLQRQGKFEEAVTAFQKSYDISERLDDDRSLAMVLNSLGGVLQRQGKYEEAVTAFQKSYELLVKLEDDRGQAMVLNSLGGVLQRQGKYEEAVTAFQKSYELLVKLEDDRGQAMVLNSLGGVLQRQGKYEEAVTAFQKSYELLVKLEDDRGQAMVLNSLGGVFSKQKKFEDSEDVFKKSISIGIRLKDKSHLAKVYTSHGKSLLDQDKFHDAAKELLSGFENDEFLKNKFGLRIVTPALVEALIADNRTNEALQICDRALCISPKDNQLQRIKHQISQPNKISQKAGSIKKILHHAKDYLYGFIVTDDGTPDIYFKEQQIDPYLLTILKEGLNVIADVEVSQQGPHAKRVWLR